MTECQPVITPGPQIPKAVRITVPRSAGWLTSRDEGWLLRGSRAFPRCQKREIIPFVTNVRHFLTVTTHVLIASICQVPETGPGMRGATLVLKIVTLGLLLGGTPGDTASPAQGPTCWGSYDR